MSLHHANPRRPWLAVLLACPLLGCSKTNPEPPAASAGGGAADGGASKLPAPEPKPESSGAPDRAEIERRIHAWLETQPETLRFELDTGKLAYDSGPKAYALDADGYSLIVDFARPLDPSASVEDLQEAFAYVVVDAVPLAIEAPGWRLQLQTPVSSTSEGFVIKSHEGGVLEAELTWRFFGVYGRKLDEQECPTILDAPTPKPCYVAVKHDLPFILHMKVPFDPT